jgi:HK97 family phage portal protein
MRQARIVGRFSAFWRAFWEGFISRAREILPEEWQSWVGGYPAPYTVTYGQEPTAEQYDRIYRTQPHVQTVVNFLAVNLAQLGIKVYRRLGNDDRIEVHDHPLAQLLRQPNPATTRYRFMADLVTDFCVNAQAFALKVRPPEGGLELYRIEPCQIRVHGDVVPRAYGWAPIGGGQVLLPPSEILHLRQPRGISPLEALRALLSEDEAATAYRSRFWQNYARLGGVIQRPAGAPRWNDDQRRMFRKQWRRYQGAQGAGRTVVLEDGMTYSQVSATAEQSQLVQSRKLSREEVAAAYHVPPAMIGIVESQGYGSIREQHKALYQDTLGPYVSMFEGDFDLQLLPEFSDNADVYVEFNINEKLQGSFEEMTAALATSTGSPYLSVNEARARVNLPKLSDPAYDKPVLRLDTASGQAQRTREGA